MSKNGRSIFRSIPHNVTKVNFAAIFFRKYTFYSLHVWKVGVTKSLFISHNYFEHVSKIMTLDNFCTDLYFIPRFKYFVFSLRTDLSGDYTINDTRNSIRLLMIRKTKKERPDWDWTCVQYWVSVEIQNTPWRFCYKLPIFDFLRPQPCFLDSQNDMNIIVWADTNWTFIEHSALDILIPHLAIAVTKQSAECSGKVIVLQLHVIRKSEVYSVLCVRETDRGLTNTIVQTHTSESKLEI